MDPITKILNLEICILNQLTRKKIREIKKGCREPSLKEQYVASVDQSQSLPMPFCQGCVSSPFVHICPYAAHGLHGLQLFEQSMHWTAHVIFYCACSGPCTQ